jgi:hypothetical protein
MLRLCNTRMHPNTTENDTERMLRDKYHLITALTAFNPGTYIGRITKDVQLSRAM